jgi:hypothetical protein
LGREGKFSKGNRPSSIFLEIPSTHANIKSNLQYYSSEAMSGKCSRHSKIQPETLKLSFNIKSSNSEMNEEQFKKSPVQLKGQVNKAAISH